MVDKCAGKVCSKDAKGRERRCNPESGRCKLTTAMNVKKNVKSDEEMIWTLVSKARQNVKGRRCISFLMSEAIEKIIVKEKMDRGRLQKAFFELRQKIPTHESAYQKGKEYEEASNFYNHYSIHSGGDSDADYQYQVIFGGKRTFYAFVNPKRTWAERMKIADEKLCIGDESDWF